MWAVGYILKLDFINSQLVNIILQMSFCTNLAAPGHGPVRLVENLSAGAGCREEWGSWPKDPYQPKLLIILAYLSWPCISQQNLSFFPSIFYNSNGMISLNCMKKTVYGASVALRVLHWIGSFHNHLYKLHVLFSWSQSSFLSPFKLNVFNCFS